MEYKNIKYITRKTKLENTIGYLYLDRVDKANALSIDMLQELNHLLDDLTKCNPRILIILSNGKNFCAGADLSWMKEECKDFELASSLLFDFLDKLDKLPIPKLALVKGACYGGGLGILGATDIVISEESSRFCLSETRLGIIPAIILPFLKKRIRYSFLINIGLNASTLDSKKALDIGLIDIIGSREDLDKLINELLSCNLNAQIELKKHCSKIFNDTIFQDNLKNYCLDTLLKIKDTPSAKEGIGSFLNKKEPNWKDSL